MDLAGVKTFDNLSIGDRTIIVAIDFGTTYSGIAWAETQRPDHISVIQQWPSRIGSVEGISSDKVPTELRYIDSGMQWGFQIPSLEERYQWFKLDFAHGIGARDRPVPPGQKRNSDELVKDYLNALINHGMYVLEQKLGRGILKDTPVEFVLTVPAIWTEIARDKTVKAFKSAWPQSSSPKINLISEPEAAAIYALHGLHPHGLQVGESFVLCDAGGGTVDLISYTVKSLHPKLEIVETAEGTGGLCGSTYLNRRFAEFLTRKLNQEEGWDAEVLADAMERFDTVIKREYLPTTIQEDGYSIPVAGLSNNAELGIRRGRFSLKPNDLKEIFEPVILQIIKLVQDQIAATRKEIKAVLLVGGFGQNAYLKDCLRASLGNGIEVLQPTNAWTAVVRGALMMGLADSDSSLSRVGVMSRAARKSYGIELAVVFDKSIHWEGTEFWDDYYGKWKVDEMIWFIKKGEALKENEPVSMNFKSKIRVRDGTLQHSILRVYCDATSPDPPLQRNGNVRELVDLTLDWNQVNDVNKLIQTGKDGQSWYVLAGRIEVTYYSASTKYTLVADGNRYDAVIAELL